MSENVEESEGSEDVKESGQQFDNIVAATRVRRFLKGEGYKVSSDVFPVVEQKVQDLLKAATERTSGNKRVMVRACDL